MVNNVGNNDSNIEILTDQQYEVLKARVSLLEGLLSSCRIKQTQIIDELCRERDDEKIYLSEIERNGELIRMYELHNEIIRKSLSIGTSPLVANDGRSKDND